MRDRAKLADRRNAILQKILARCVRRPRQPGQEIGCLEWQGPDSGDGRGGGYPRMSLDGQTVAVHLVIANHFLGYIPGKKQIDHECGNRRCLEWTHMDIVTASENCRRRNGRKPQRRGNWRK
ncbi:HNH endonuclease [Oricola thermophila]|uniref:HNH endonuclease n=2 Tax=Oricola thermophila TaxID=2742145 RepID=A0A6N1VJX8_9HYPH|nr:HNH endonuclease [Oricola thermophila]